MIKNSKFVKTAFAVAVLGLATLSAQAATMSVTSRVFATQVFAGTNPGDAITLQDIKVVNAVPLAIGDRVTVAVKLNGAKFASGIAGMKTGAVSSAAVVVGGAANLGAAILATGSGAIEYGSTISGSTAATGGTATSTASTNNADVIFVTFTATAAAPLGSNLLTLTAPTVSAAGMAVSGATVTAEAMIYVGLVAPTFGTAIQTSGSLEAAATPATVATSANGITITTAAATTDQRINLNATISSSSVTAGTLSATATGSTSQIQIGTLAMVASATAKDAGGNAYGVGAKNTSLILTAPVGYWAGLGTTGVVEVRANNAQACQGAVSTASTAFATAAAAAAATTVNITPANLAAVATTVPYHICISSIPGTVALATGAATLTGTLGTTVAQDSAVSLTSKDMASLASNGSTYDVQSYWPGALTGYKYSGYLRLTNTGTVAADVTAQNFTTAGVLNTAQPAKVIATGLAAGESRLLSTAAIDAIIGANPSGLTAGRVRITAPTNGLRVISMLQVDGGQLIEYPNVNNCTTSGAIAAVSGGGTGGAVGPGAGFTVAAVTGGGGTVTTTCTSGNSTN